MRGFRGNGALPERTPAGHASGDQLVRRMEAWIQTLPMMSEWQPQVGDVCVECGDNEICT